MPLYLCGLVGPGGRAVEVTREAASAEDAAALFSRGGAFLVSVKELGGHDARHRSGGSMGRRPGARPGEVGELVSMLSALLDAGLQLKDSLAVAAGSAPRGSGGARLARGLLESVEKGARFSEAVASCGEFPRFCRGMIGIGERVGSVERVMPRLASYLAGRKALRDKLTGALVYPAIVCALAILGAAAVLVFLVPELLSMLSRLGGAAADQARRSATAMTGAACGAGGLVLAASVSAIALRAARKRSEDSAAWIDRLVLRLPIVGALVIAFETLGFASAMEAVAGGGLPLEAGLEAAAEVSGNRAFRAAVAECAEAAMRGEPLSIAAARRPEFPPRVAQWLAIGERTGKAELVFGQLRRYYQGEADRMSSRLAALAEPVLILAAGGLVLSMLLAFVVPLFSMYGAAL